jgi:hypothetical protein
MHSRVAMMAVVGYLIGENTPTIVDTTGIIANNQLAEMPGFLTWPLFLFINFAEAWRATNGWVEPSKDSLFTLRDKYYPGGIGTSKSRSSRVDCEDNSHSTNNMSLSYSLFYSQASIHSTSNHRTPKLLPRLLPRNYRMVGWPCWP